MSQDHRPIECVVVDDGSEPPLRDTVASLGAPEVRYVRHAVARERAEAKNSGLDAASGTWSLVLDHDDLLATGCIASLMAHAVATSADAVFGRSEPVDEGQHPPWEAARPGGAARRVPWPSVFRSSDNFGNVLVRTDLARRIRFSSDHVPADDYLYAMHVAAAGIAVRAPVVVGGWRQHDRQTTRTIGGTALPRAASRARAAMLATPSGPWTRRRLEAFEALRGTGYIAWTEGDRAEFRRSTLDAIRLDPTLLLTQPGFRAALAALSPKGRAT